MRAVKIADAFLATYAAQAELLKSLVDVLQGELISEMDDAGIGYASIYGRPKTLESVRGKLLRKPYANPSRDMTDQVGLRVVVIRGSEVDDAVAAIKRRLVVVSTKSVDKRTSLGLREFGYRSVHLICRVPPRVRNQFSTGLPRTFEIQVRSLLEHAWAEIEHGVVYKAGAELPTTLLRRFASLAATIELIEAEFERLGAETSRLVDKEKSEIFVRGFGRRALDVPRMIAVLETYRPGGASLRSDANGGMTVTPALLTRIVDALRMCGLKSSVAFATALTSRELAVVVNRFARAEYLNSDAVSHLAVTFLIIGRSDSSVLKTFFPEFSISPSIEAALVL